MRIVFHTNQAFHHIAEKKGHATLENHKRRFWKCDKK